MWIVLPFVTGIIAARITETSVISILVGVAAVGAVLAGTRREFGWWSLGMIVGGCAAGAASYARERARIRDWDGLPPREAQVSIRIDRIFGARDERRLSGLAQIITAAPPLAELAGQHIYFSCAVRDGEPRPSRSAVLRAGGVLVPVSSAPPADSFDGYLASAGVNFRLQRGRFKAVARPQREYYRFCDIAAERFRVILGQGIEQKQPRLAGLLRAMMLGDTRELTEDQHTMFMQSGTMHLFAISGMNIGVIAAAMQALLALIRVPAWIRFLIAVPLLWLFVDVTGAAPSAVRAFAMCVFFHGAFVIRRPANPIAAIVASAAIILVWAPLQLFSASFLMSYAIVLALLLLGLPLSETWVAAGTPWRDLPVSSWTSMQKRLDEARRALTAAIAIGVATTPVGWLTGIQFFRLLTPGALVANLLLIPAAGIVTLGGFAALVCGLAGFSTGVVLCNHASALVLLAIERLVRWSVMLPGAFVTAQFKDGWVGGTALALVIGALLWGYGTGWRRERGGWWPPFGIVAVTLLFGVDYG